MNEDYKISLPKTENPIDVCIALSGGVDSIVLAHLCFIAQKEKRIRNLRAVHVNHGLSEYAPKWQTECALLCKNWGITLYTEQVNLQRISRKGIECIARDARYRVFAEQLKEGEYLFQGHHQNDQAETLLFRLFRGSDSKGLCAIPESRPLQKGTVFRPLLHVNRAWIQHYAEKNKLTWVEDDSNQNTQFDRNFIRHNVLPILQQRWPVVVSSLANTAYEQLQSKRLLDDLAEIDLENIEANVSPPVAGDVNGVNCKSLLTLPKHRQINAIQFWLEKHKVTLPSKKYLHIFLQEMLTAAADRHPVIPCKNQIIRRWQHWMIITPPTPLIFTKECSLNLTKSSEFVVNNCTFYVELTDDKPLLVSEDIEQLTICYRNSCSTIPPFAVAGRQGTKTLKKWLNEFKVPAYIKDYTPLLCLKGELVLIPGLFVNEKFKPENKRGWFIKSVIQYNESTEKAHL